MNKAELLIWLQEEHQQWEALLERIDPAQMDQIGVNSQWSFKDLIAHLIPDGLRCIASLQAIQRNEPAPPPPWPVYLQTDDEINAWIYETTHERSAHQVLDESHQMFQQLFNMVKELPEDVKIDTVNQGERMHYLVRLGDQHVQPGYFFDHFHDDHEQDVRAWLTRIEKG
ncbi:MAG: ClbS/DfsB family four-helix bundle protein [Anaerolineales bacterium]